MNQILKWDKEKRRWKSTWKKNSSWKWRQAERIRTYNFPQGRVTDHRISLTIYNLEEILNGEFLDEIISGLIADANIKKNGRYSDEVDFFELIDIENFLSKHGVKMARFETMILAEKTLNMQRLEFYKFRNPFRQKQKKKFLKRLFKRTEGRPISKICGKNFFLMNSM